MVDGWMGDDCPPHYGAFRQTNLDYFTEQTTKQDVGSPVVRGALDDYETFRDAGSADYKGRAANRGRGHAHCGTSSLRCVLAGTGTGQANRPEAAFGSPHVAAGAVGPGGHVGCDSTAIWRLAGRKDRSITNYLVDVGLWRHSQVNGEGYGLGPFKWDGDTMQQFRRDVLNRSSISILKDGAPKNGDAARTEHNTGQKHGDRLKSWPPACAKRMRVAVEGSVLEAGSGLSIYEAHGNGIRFHARIRRSQCPKQSHA